MTLLRKWRELFSRSIASAAVQIQESCSNIFQGNLDIVQLENVVSRVESGQVIAGIDDYAFLLRQCGILQSLNHGTRVLKLMDNARGIFRDRYLCNLAVGMYGKCKSPANAEAVFRNINYPNVFSWTMLMLAYGQNGYEKKGILIFSLMDLDGVPPSKVAFSAVLSLCARLGSYQLAKILHSCLETTALETDVHLRTATLSMYAKCRQIQDAKRIFDRMEEKTEITWNAMISAYAQQGHAREALTVFRRMDQEGVKPNDVSFVCLLEAWTHLGDVLEVNKVERRVFELGFSSYKTLQVSILCFYGKHGKIEDSRRVFDSMPCKHTVAWNAIIGVYSQQGQLREALKLYEQMKLEEVKPDEITFVVVLDACSNLGKLSVGKMVHGDMVSQGIKQDAILTNVLLNMYGRCGSLEGAKGVFKAMEMKTAATWNSMMTQYAQHGQGAYALEMFLDMQLEGVKMDDITFITVLSLCSHMGHLKEGMELFFSLKMDYGIVYTVEHYGCLVDLLGRAGMLQHAEEVMDVIPFEVNPVVYTSLLNACLLHGDVERGRSAAERAMVVEPESDATLLTLEKIYANAGRAKEFPKVKASLLEIRNKVLKDGKH